MTLLDNEHVFKRFAMSFMAESNGTTEVYCRVRWKTKKEKLETAQSKVSEVDTSSLTRFVRTECVVTLFDADYIPTQVFYDLYLKFCGSSSLLAEPVTKRAIGIIGARFERQAQTNISSASRTLRSGHELQTELTPHQKLAQMVEVIRRLRPKTLREKADFSKQAGALDIQTVGAHAMMDEETATRDEPKKETPKGVRASARRAVVGTIDAIKQYRNRAIAKAKKAAEEVKKAAEEVKNQSMEATHKLRKQGVGLISKMQTVVDGTAEDDAKGNARRRARKLKRMKDASSLALFLQANYTLTTGRGDLILAENFKNKYKEFCAEQHPPIKLHPITPLTFEAAAVEAFDPRERFQFKEPPELTRVVPDELKLVTSTSTNADWWNANRPLIRKFMYDAPIVSLQLAMTLLPLIPNFMLVWLAEVDATSRFQKGYTTIAQQAGGGNQAWRVSARDLLLRWWELSGMQVRIYHLAMLGVMGLYMFVAAIELLNYYSSTMFGMKEDVKSKRQLEEEGEEDADENEDFDGESIWSLVMRWWKNSKANAMAVKKAGAQMTEKAGALMKDNTKDNRSWWEKLIGRAAPFAKLRSPIQGGVQESLEAKHSRLLRDKLKELVKEEVEGISRPKMKAAMQNGVGAGIKMLVDPIVKELAGLNSREQSADPKKVAKVEAFWGGKEPEFEWIKKVRPDGVDEDIDIPMMGDEASRLVSSRYRSMTKLDRLKRKIKTVLVSAFLQLFHRLLVAFMCFYLACFVGYIALVLVWCILGAVLNPDVFLPYAAAAATLVTFATSKVRQLTKLRSTLLRRVVDAVRDRFDRTLRSLGMDQEAADKLLNGDMSREEIKQRLLEKGTVDMMQRSPLGTVASALGVDASMAAKLAIGDESAVFDMAEKMGMDRHVMMALVAVVRRNPADLEAAVGKIAENPGVPIDPEFAKILTKLAYKGGGERPEKLVKQAVNIFNRSDKTDIKLEVQHDATALHYSTTVSVKGQSKLMKCALDPQVAEAVVALAQGKLDTIVLSTDELARTNPKMFPPALSYLVNVVYYKATNQSNQALDSVVDLACSVNLKPKNLNGTYLDRRLMGGLATMYRGNLEGVDDVLKVLGVGKGGALVKIIIAIAQGNTSLLRGPLLDDFTRELEKLLRLPDHSVNSNHLTALFACVQGTEVDTKQLAALAGLDTRIAETAIFILEGRRISGDEVLNWNVHPIAWLADVLDTPAEYLLGVIALLQGHAAYPESQLLIDYTITSMGLDPKIKRPLMHALDFLGSMTERKVVASALHLYNSLPDDFKKAIASGVFVRLVLVGRGLPVSEIEMIRAASGASPVQEVRSHIESRASSSSSKALPKLPSRPAEDQEGMSELEQLELKAKRREYEQAERRLLQSMLAMGAESKAEKRVSMAENIRLRWAIFKHDAAAFESFVQALMNVDHKLTRAATGTQSEGEPHTNEIEIADFLKLLKKKAHKDTRRAEEAKTSSTGAPSSGPMLSPETVATIASLLRLSQGAPAFLADMFFQAGAVTDGQQRACTVLCDLPTLFATSNYAKRKQRIERTGLQLGKMLDVHPRCLSEFLMCCLTPLGHVRAEKCCAVIKTAGSEDMQLVEKFIERFTVCAHQSALAKKAVDKFADSVKIPRFVLHAIRTGTGRLGEEMVQEMYKLIILCINEDIAGPGTAHSMARSLVALVMGNESRLDTVAQAFGLDALFLSALCKSYQTTNSIEPKREVIRRVLQTINENEIRAMVMHRVAEANKKEVETIRTRLTEEHATLKKNPTVVHG
jgi:hypothetical protein